MLKVRVIPTLLWKNVGLVKGIGFNSWRRVGSVVPTVKVYNSRDVDELILVDILASLDGEEIDVQSVSDISEECFVPLTVGGGINSLDQIVSLLHSGADKISINSECYANPDIVDLASKRFGAQCVVASIDVRANSFGKHICFSHAGSVDTGKEVTEHAKELAARGCGEILLTSIDKDGSMAGYDLHLIEKVANAVDVPVIASGGAGSYQHMIDAVKKSGAAAVAAASIFHFTEMTPLGAKEAMHTAGIPVRQKFRISNLIN
ncbi:MAG: imidazole glycerol phosphate synthase cyclase subunit [Imperialibacter sp.]|uniref:imidazole glycerol phosphate synthase subunit HisF n=1 Tax=Imperialibacter sp. TaxID=2038411 RepID=UPI0032F055A5